MIRYLVTTYPHATGANLSKPGHWGNLPHTSVAAARAAAVKDAAGEPHVIDTKAIRRPLKGS